MSIKFRITKYLAVSALAMLLLGACSKNNIYIDLADPNEENGNDCLLYTSDAADE